MNALIESVKVMFRSQMQLDVVSMSLAIICLNNVKRMNVTRNGRLGCLNSGLCKKLQQLILGLNLSIID